MTIDDARQEQGTEAYGSTYELEEAMAKRRREANDVQHEKKYKGEKEARVRCIRNIRMRWKSMTS